MSGASLLLWCTLAVASGWSISSAVAAPLALEVAHASQSFNPRTGEPIVAVTLTAPSRELYAGFTRENVGKTIQIRVDGRDMMKLAIREPLLQGRILFSGRFTVPEARDVAERLSRGVARLEVEALAN